MMRVLDIFSGVGMFSFGLEQAGGFETSGFCELDPWLRRVLRAHWPGVHIFDDIRLLTGDTVHAACGAVDVVAGGYPCQPFSQAGQRRGERDPRHLWPEMLRLVDELRPRWVVGENVHGHVKLGLDTVLDDLEARGYACRAVTVPALAVGARHLRRRVWWVAHSDANRAGCGIERKSSVHVGTNPFGDDAYGLRSAVANASGPGLPDVCGREAEAEGARDAGPRVPYRDARGRWTWPPEPGVGRVADGRSARMDRRRLRALGNSLVWPIVTEIGRAILAAEAADIEGAA